MKLTIWHNNSCSTSRKALEFLEQKGYDLTVINYIANPPSIKELEEVLRKMNTTPISILRKKDKVYQEKFADKNFSNNDWIEAMHLNPSIIERPIVISDKKAWLARPFEKWSTEFTI